MIAARWAVELLASSWSFDVIGGAHRERLRSSGARLIYAVWHSGLLPALWWHRDESMTLLISQHQDGSRLAKAVTSWGYRVVRGSSTRGGASGLRGLLQVLRSGGTVALTPDGPRGPERIAKPGAVAAAQRTGAVILPVGTAAAAAWRTRSWDRFLVPRPFTRVRVVYGDPFAVGPGPAALAEGIERLQASLTAAAERAECPG